MSRALYVDCIGGLAGDMLLAALLDAGGDAELLRSVPARLGIAPVEIRIERVERHGVGALHVDVVPLGEPPPRTWRGMREIVEGADLPERARRRSLDPLRLLAEAEAKIHGAPVDDVQFHEIGGVDTLVDVSGVALLLEDLGVDSVFCSVLPYAQGLVRAVHGFLPVPAPDRKSVV